MWQDAAIGVAIGLVTCWAVLVVGLLLVRPRGGLLTEAVRVLPDLLRLVTRMARDGSLPRGVRWRLGLLLAYLALPVDLIPDFLPVVGYADAAIRRTASSITAGDVPRLKRTQPVAVWS